MRAVSNGRLAANSPSFERHIDRCLGCRACEMACPAGVEYGQLLEASRAAVFLGNAERGFTYAVLRQTLRHIWLHRRRLRLFFGFARAVRTLRLPAMLRKIGLSQLLPTRMRFALAMLESSAQSHGASTTQATTPKPKSAQTGKPALLFSGCVGEGLFERVNLATSRVLEVNGFAVERPVGQVCCGALHAHAGDLEGARVLAQKNIEAFEHGDGAAIVTNAGGCGAMLKSYQHLLVDKQWQDRAHSFSSRIFDVSQVLVGGNLVEGKSVGNEAVTYDASCHLMYGQHASESALQLLRSIPGLTLVPLNDSERCCGGAGVYNLMETDLSGKVLSEKLSCIRASGAERLATGNPGCQMHIGAGSRLSGMKLSVCHPVELLDESYQIAGFYE
jgi:glycolate oxidase iron-sulfur subunit